MPIGIEVGRQVQKKFETNHDYDDRGEEGIFHIVNVDGTRYWAKEWYKMHDKAKGVPVTEKASPCSPYWHKVKFYEYQLIHDAFPTHTVELVAGYNERTKEEGHNEPGKKEYSFNLFTGRPTTVSVEITGEPALSDKRNKAMREAYAVLLNFIDQNARTATSTKGHPFFPAWGAQVNERMQAILGKDIHIPFISIEASSMAEYERKLSAAIAKLAAELKRQNPNSIIPEMMDNGIMPIHPELNFIPGTKESHPRPPHGTFIEATIRDLNRFIAKRRQALAGQPEQLASFNRHVERYTLYRLLDKIFDDMILFANYGAKDNWKFEQEIQTALFRVTEAIRDAYDGQGIEFDEITLGNLQTAISDMFRRGFFPHHVATLIQTEIVQPLKEMSKRKK